MRNYGGLCVPVEKCKAMCCIDNINLSYVEFAYLYDYLTEQAGKEGARELLTRDPRPMEAPDFPGARVVRFGERGETDAQHSCRLLGEDFRCQAYPARPLGCRMYKNTREGERPWCQYEHSTGHISPENSKALRQTSRLLKSLDIPEEWKREESMNFWVERFVSGFTGE
jgi:Fe-S-cluster containining protein